MHAPLAIIQVWIHTSTFRKCSLHDCFWLWVDKPCPLHTLPLSSVVSNRSTSSQQSAVLVLSPARGPDIIEFSSTGIHKHTALIILPRTYVMFSLTIQSLCQHWDNSRFAWSEKTNADIFVIIPCYLFRLRALHHIVKHPYLKGAHL